MVGAQSNKRTRKYFFIARLNIPITFIARLKNQNRYSSFFYTLKNRSNCNALASSRILHVKYPIVMCNSDDKLLIFEGEKKTIYSWKTVVYSLSGIALILSQGCRLERHIYSYRPKLENKKKQLNIKNYENRYKTLKK